MYDSSWMEHPNIKNIDARKLEVLKQLMKESESLSMNQAIPLLLKASKQLSKENLKFTPEESATIIDLLSARLSPEENSKFQAMKQIMQQVKK